MNFTNSISKNFFIILFGIFFVLIVSTAFFNIISSYYYQKNSFVQESRLQASLIAENSITDIQFGDKEELENKLLLLSKYPNIKHLLIYDKHGKLFLHYCPEHEEEFTMFDKDIYWLSSSVKTNSIFFADSLVIREKIALNGVNYGYLYLQKDVALIKKLFHDTILNVVVFSIVLMIVVIILIKRASKELVDPIVKLSDEIIKISDLNDYSIRLKYNQDNEIGKLYHSFNNLFASIQEHQKSRDEALKNAKVYQKHLEELKDLLEEKVQQRTLELQQNIQRLEETKNQLIESEKMAALGSLVSGVAHEVNTPLGNAITGNSVVRKKSSQLLSMMEEGSLKKSFMQESLHTLVNTSTLVQKSLNVAAELIRSFKKISVDQSISSVQEFNLAEYIQEVLLTFHNKLKHKHIDIEVISNKNVMIKSDPGAFAQLLNNFIQNSIMHAFEEKKEGAKITIELYEKDDRIYFIYSDNGCGIDESILDKVFEPFVTTKRNSGGTGLGLGIVYNIVTQKLKATLNMSSKKGEGVTFSIVLPKDINV